MEEAVSLFHKFVGKNLTGGLGGSHPGGLCSDEDPDPARGSGPHSSSGIRHAGHSDYKFVCKACGTGWPEAANHQSAHPFFSF